MISEIDTSTGLAAVLIRLVCYLAISILSGALVMIIVSTWSRRRVRSRQRTEAAEECESQR